MIRIGKGKPYNFPALIAKLANASQANIITR